ncbi:oxidoreductase [Cohnella faecalis]|uniref:SDR family oxidoreductase n=1 Tax=Cohnella faecalis TaxID=2315694 RepID=A0A398CI45_9BACL|nr:oxidoreductase [Cohnella faecalis]RIE02936.1 SDR family oxidoreductase [Cohnella faecalis]
MSQSADRLEYPTRERIAIVTGTSSGFGMLTAVELARKNYRVIATMRNPERAIELRERAERAGVTERIEIHGLDVTDSLSIERVVADTLRVHGRIDVLVNNAGFAVGGFVEEVSMESWRRQMETNFFGLVAVTQSVIPAMRQQRSGLIINIGSISGRMGFPGYAPYAASKFAVEGFSESLRHELAPFGISVVLVEPGAYRTPIWDKGLEQISGSDNSPYIHRLRAILRYSRRAAETAPDPQQVADLIGRLAGARSPRLRYPIGRGSLLALWGKALLPWKWFERLIERGTR